MNSLLKIRAALFVLAGIVTLGGLHLTLAMAEETSGSGSTPRRLYLGASVGATRLSPESEHSSLTAADRSAAGYGLTLGLDLSRRFSLEGYYHDLGAAGIDFLGEHVGDLDYAVYGIGAVGYLFGRRLDNGLDGLSRREGLSGFVRLGIGRMQNDSSLEYRQDHGTHAAIGLGIEYGWANGLALRGELQSFDSDAQFINLSLLKRFGSVPVPLAATPEPAAVPVAEPAPEPVEVEIPTIYFEFSKYDLTPQAQAKLRTLAEAMDFDKALKLQLDGHTDWIDTEQYNQNLSEQRATAVREFLLDQGLPPGSIQITGFGETRPVTTNRTDQGRALNRRVEISIQ